MNEDPQRPPDQAGDRGSNLYLRKTRCQREIEATDRQIDQLVYELYGNLIPI